MVSRPSAGSYGAALILLSTLSAGSAHAQATGTNPAPATTTPESAESKADAAEAAEEAQDAIVVTGQKQRGAVATDIPPEVSVGSAAIRALGAADLQEVFQELAPEISGGTGESGTAGKDPIVLVNGQRIAGFSTIKDLPPEAVLRVEVFPEKVALQYGYAPGQRVVNVVLRSRYKALTLLARDTLAPNNWRGIYRGKLDLLRIGENSHWNIDLDYHHLDPIYAGSTLSGTDLIDTGSSDVPRHTLATQDDGLTISGDHASKIGDVSVELTGRLDLDAQQSRPGLSDEDGALLAEENLASLGDFATGPLNRADRTVEAQTNLTLNGNVGNDWRWSFLGNLDEKTRITTTGIATDTGALRSILLPSPGLLGNRCSSVATSSTDGTGCVSTTTRTAGGDFYLNGHLFALPAGSVTAALRTGFAFSGIRSASPSDAEQTSRNRTEGNVQANLDFPITSAASPIGKLSIGVNGEARQLSDFGTLSTYGSSFEWSPIKKVTLIGSIRREEQAPSLLQLGEATLTTPDLREYDFVEDGTAIVTRTEGGNADLKRQTSHIANLRLQVHPIRTADLLLSADYTIDRTRNPITSISAATAATMAAFPDHFTRDTNGYLTSIDVSPVNLYSRDRQQIRWGLNYTTAFGAMQQASGNKPASRNQFQIALYDTWRLQDDVVLQQGEGRLNLLGGDIISDGGGTPRHEVELQTTVATRKWSADISADWQTPVSADSGTAAADRLTFSQGVKLNLRLQINLTEQHWLTRRLPWLRGNLNLSADNLLGAHTIVHDASGAVPPAYGASYINPTGRTFRITLRKRFR